MKQVLQLVQVPTSPHCGIWLYEEITVTGGVLQSTLQVAGTFMTGIRQKYDYKVMAFIRCVRLNGLLI